MKLHIHIMKETAGEEADPAGSSIGPSIMTLFLKSDWGAPPHHHTLLTQIDNHTGGGLFLLPTAAPPPPLSLSL